MKAVNVKVLFQTSRRITQTEGLQIWGGCSYFGARPGKRTYRIVWRLESPDENGRVTNDDKNEAAVIALEKLDLLLQNFDDITFSVIDVKTTKGAS